MSADRILLGQARNLMKAMDKTADKALPDQISQIVKFHSKGAAAAALGSGWIPGAGGAVATAISAGFVWSMYGRIGAKIGLPFGQHVLKSLATGVATNLARAAVGAVVVSSAFSLVPGLGSIGSSVIMAATSYALTLASGYVYLKVMTKLFAKGIDLSTVGEQDLQDLAESAAKESDVGEMIEEAKADFHRRGKQGAVT